MMATTHVLIGALFGVLVGSFAPDQATAAVLAGMAGGLFPDLDMLSDHRKTLHYPVYFPFLSGFAGIVFLLFPTTLTVVPFVFLFAASIHTVMDVFSCGRELRPWEKSDDRAVFSHYSEKWVRARRFVSSGSLADFVLGALAAVPVLLGSGGEAATLALTVLALSVPYPLLRRRMAAHIPREYQTLSHFLQYRLTQSIDRLRGVDRQ